ncbi:MAG: M20/M25/M40 family metallo-hydrolase [Candidatus Bathyarchaeota archaeon]|nr:MAG: M20/M25/M40 family metallo-hydrolase [Candidatus Bathyarchaeota archaeon]
MVKLSFLDLLDHAAQYEARAVELIRELVGFPTVAFREPEAIVGCAQILREILQAYGYDAEIYPTAPNGSPVVYGEKDVGAPKTLMFYRHYDVQPEDPLDLWDSPPWELTERGGRLYARGTADNKGQFVFALLAIQLLEDQLGELPVNVKFVCEGEEEAGSKNLPRFTNAHSNLLEADGCSWEGIGMYLDEDEPIVGGKPNLPTPFYIYCGLKGIAYFELTAGGSPRYPNRDVHSGQAAAVPNAAWRMVWALNTLKDCKENILLEGFDELVRPPIQEDIDSLKAIDVDLAEIYKSDYKLDELLLGREGLDLYVELALKPSLSICGFTSGYSGPGTKTIAPARAKIKMDFRLVPDLTMDRVDELLREHLIKHGFDDIGATLISGYDPAKTPVSHPFITMVRDATRDLVAPTPVNVIPMAFGSGPAYLFSPHTPICYGGNPVEGINGHAPNENIPKSVIKSNIAFNAYIAQLLAEQR